MQQTIKQIVNELNLHHIEKHSSRCSHSTSQSAVVERENFHKERNDKRLGIDKTRSEWIWERLAIHIIFRPSEMKNG